MTNKGDQRTTKIGFLKTADAAFYFYQLAVKKSKVTSRLVDSSPQILVVSEKELACI